MTIPITASANSVQDLADDTVRNHTKRHPTLTPSSVLLAAQESLEELIRDHRTIRHTPGLLPLLVGVHNELIRRRRDHNNVITTTEENHHD